MFDFSVRDGVEVAANFFFLGGQEKYWNLFFFIKLHSLNFLIRVQTSKKKSGNPSLEY
jgi:hypothetical protein